MTARQELHQLVDELPEDQAELARGWLQDLRDAADEDGPPLDAEALASLDRGLADLAAGRVKPLAEYKRERGLLTFESACPRPLTETPGIRKSRVGGWRILFSVDREAQVVYILTVDTRGQVYKHS